MASEPPALTALSVLPIRPILSINAAFAAVTTVTASTAVASSTSGTAISAIASPAAVPSGHARPAVTALRAICRAGFAVLARRTVKPAAVGRVVSSQGRTGRHRQHHGACQKKSFCSVHRELPVARRALASILIRRSTIAPAEQICKTGPANIALACHHDSLSLTIGDP